MSEVETLERLSEIISKKNRDKTDGDYYWEIVDGCDAYLHLGQIRKAVVIRKSLKYKYFISMAGYFPVTNEMYDKRFDTLSDAIKYANEFIKGWLEQTYKALEL